MLSLVFIFLLTCGFSKPADLLKISGKLVRLEKGALVIETAPGTDYTALIRQDIIALNHGHAFPLTWLLPGDGITAVVNRRFGKAMLLETDIEWTAGTVAFSSPDRLTLTEGRQFFLSGAPVYLNGAQIDPSKLKSPEQVLVRFDKKHFRVVGAWAFKPSDAKPVNLSQTHPSLLNLPHGDRLWIQVLGTAGQRLSAEIPGVTKRFWLVEKNGENIYHGKIPVPAGISIPQCRLLVQSASETWIDPVPFSIVTESAELREFGPPDGVTAPINPPFIFVSFDKSRPPISPNSTELFVDRKSVTGVSYLDDYTIFYAPAPLAPGKHECYVTGENFHQAWSFFVP